MNKNFLKFIETKGFNENSFNELEAEKQVEIQRDYLGYLEEEMKSFASPEKIAQITKGLVTLEQFETLGDLVNQIKDDSKKNELVTGSILKNIEMGVKENHAKIVEAIKNRSPFELTLKAANIHLTSNTITGLGVGDITSESARTIAGFDDVPTPPDFILNVIPNSVVDNCPSDLSRIEKATTEGAFAVVAEGGVKPLMQYKFVKSTTERIKVAARIEWSEEFAKDYTLLFAEIQRAFLSDFVSDYQDKLFAEIDANALPYVSSVLDDTLLAPDNGLSIVAGQSALQQLNFNPNWVLMNPADLVATLFVQDDNGNLKMNPYINVTAGTINGVRYIANNKVLQGEAYVGDFSKYAEFHEAPTLRAGQYNAQFIENEYTLIIETFFILSIAELNLPAIMKLDLDAVKALLLKP